jgi:hypothetical protein
LSQPLLVQCHITFSYSLLGEVLNEFFSPVWLVVSFWWFWYGGWCCCEEILDARSIGGFDASLA